MACGIYFPDQGSNSGPLHWEQRVLATGTPGKSLQLFPVYKKPSCYIIVSLIARILFAFKILYGVSKRNNFFKSKRIVSLLNTLMTSGWGSWKTQLLVFQWFSKGANKSIKLGFSTRRSYNRAIILNSGCMPAQILDHVMHPDFYALSQNHQHRVIGVSYPSSILGLRTIITGIEGVGGVC